MAVGVCKSGALACLPVVINVITFIQINSAIISVC